jgi:endonuclease/exonuclease/phosphatase (EEP) superfamily protein YafD
MTTAQADAKSRQPTISICGLASAFVAVASVVTLLCSVAGFFGRHWWVLDLGSHFRVQYMAALVVLGITWFALKRYKLAGLFLMLAIANGLIVAPHLPKKSKVTPQGQVLRLAFVNVHTANTRYDLVREFIHKLKPDILVLQEVDGRWLDQLADLAVLYPHSVAEARSDNFGIALFSTIPLIRSEVICLADSDVPSIWAAFEFANRPVSLLAIHALPPVNAEYSRLNKGQLAAIPEIIEGAGPVIVVGDLNSTPWNFSFKELLQEANLLNTADGFGIQATWPANLWPLRIPIDHCLVSPEFDVISRQIGKPIGSDHLPIFIELSLRDGL